MTDSQDNHETIIKLWDISARKMKDAKTIEELCEALSSMFIAIRPLIQRETVLDTECKQRMAECPARAIVVGGNTQPAVTALINRSPLLMLVAIFGFIVYHAVKFFSGGG